MQCLNCKTETTNDKFCCRQCSAVYNNTNNHWRSKIVKVIKTCLNCGSVCNNKYCNTHCQKMYEAKSKIADNTVSSHTIKWFLINTIGNICSVCNITEWNNKPISMELEHINGNSDDNTLENCCLICPNCHSQTSTYKAKNKGNGRHTRRLRYQEGKSY